MGEVFDVPSNETEVVRKSCCGNQGVSEAHGSALYLRLADNDTCASAIVASIERTRPSNQGRKLSSSHCRDATRLFPAGRTVIPLATSAKVTHEIYRSVS